MQQDRVRDEGEAVPRPYKLHRRLPAAANAPAEIQISRGVCPHPVAASANEMTLVKYALSFRW